MVLNNYNMENIPDIVIAAWIVGAIVILYIITEKRK
jgi:hypothetical protein|tara:strand:- start:454 stop:561 length:108 start_codon:yes stop_codon:yes gene_type:complete